MIINKGICSVSFRPLSVEEIIKITKENGLNCIEWGSDVHVPTGNFDAAKNVREITLNAGLKLLSYGSYFKCENSESFEAVSKTAEVLGTDIIRIWAGTKDADKFSDEEFKDLIKIVQECADIAKKRGQTIAFEFHFGTYNNCAQNSLKLLKAIGKDNVKTYWQPVYWIDYGSDEEEIEINDKSIQELYAYIVGVHVYAWKRFDRFPLADYLVKWKEYNKALPNTNGYLEFFLHDTVEQFVQDAKIFCNKI